MPKNFFTHTMSFDSILKIIAMEKGACENGWWVNISEVEAT